MARRGDQLREHILWSAKDVFLEAGFERASMDAVAHRAETSKRSLYAHFESKEKLFLAVIELVRGLFFTRLRQPGEYAAEPAEALILFCSQYLKLLLYQAQIRMLRISMAEAERFPEQAAQYFDLLFTQVNTCLRAYLQTTFELSEDASTEAAQELLGRVLYARFTRALLGVDPPMESLDREGTGPAFDVKPIQTAVAALLASIEQIESIEQIRT